MCIPSCRNIVWRVSGWIQPSSGKLYRCKKCSNKTLSLLIPLSLAGVILVAFMLLLNLTVDVGSMNGLILYANIVSINQGLLFPQTNIYYSSIILAWLNLDLGIETCFYNGMDAYSTTSLEFAYTIIPPLASRTLSSIKAQSEVLLSVETSPQHEPSWCICYSTASPIPNLCA